MEKIGILIDSTTITRTDILEYPFLKVASLNVTIDGIDQPEISISTEKIIEKLHTAKKMTTSQPAPGDILAKYEEFFKEGYTHVLVVTLSVPLSGTYQAALVAKSLMENPMTIEVRAPQVASYGVALGVKELCEIIKNNATFEEVLRRYESLYKDASVMFTLSDLLHLFKGGRLGIVSALIGTVLRIKPIVEMIEGRLELTKKERTNQACYEFFLEKLDRYEKQYKKVYVDIIELNRLEWADKLEQTIRERYPETSIHRTNYVSPVFFIHLGDQGFGLSIIGEETKE